MPTLTIQRITPTQTDLLEEFLRDLEGDTAVAGFRASGVPLASDTFWLWLAVLDDQPVGLASVVLIPKADVRRGFLFVDELLVLPHFRRRGVARALLAHIDQTAHDQNLAGVRLLVRPENEAARALYAERGYEVSDTGLAEKRNL